MTRRAPCSRRCRPAKRAGARCGHSKSGRAPFLRSSAKRQSHDADDGANKAVGSNSSTRLAHAAQRNGLRPFSSAHPSTHRTIPLVRFTSPNRSRSHSLHLVSKHTRDHTPARFPLHRLPTRLSIDTNTGTMILSTMAAGAPGAASLAPALLHAVGMMQQAAFVPSAFSRSLSSIAWASPR